MVFPALDAERCKVREDGGGEARVAVSCRGVEDEDAESFVGFERSVLYETVPCGLDALHLRPTG